MEAMTQEQRQKTKEALSRYGQKNWVYGMEFGGLEVHFKVDGEVLTVTGIYRR